MSRHIQIQARNLQTQARLPHVSEEPTISGHLQGAHVSAFPDTGAASNFISLPYARRHGFAIDEKFLDRVKIGDGSEICVVGTTTLLFSFAGEETKHDLTFHVLRKSVHDVILGGAFLRASETFTRFAHRVGRKIRESVGHGIRGLCFLGSQEYVRGAIDGISVDAVPDTGAHVSVMSARFAKANGFKIERDTRHRIPFGFADGSTARARGVVKNVEWNFGADEQSHPTEVYVLSGLPVDLVLSDGFLCQTKAFLEHKRHFWHVEGLGRDSVPPRLCIIRRLKGATNDARRPLCKYPCIITIIQRSDI
jgi:predicted aspartyl protease